MKMPTLSLKNNTAGSEAQLPMPKLSVKGNEFAATPKPFPVSQSGAIHSQKSERASGAESEVVPLSRAIELSNARIRYNRAKSAVEADRHSANDIYSNDFAAREAEQVRREANEQKLRDAETQMKRLGLESEVDPSLGERIKKIVTGGVKDSASKTLETAALANQAAGPGNDKRRQAEAETGEAFGNGFLGTFARQLIGNPSSGNAGADTMRKNLQAMDDDTAPQIYDAAERLGDSAAADIERAQQGTNGIERALVNAGVAGVQMTGDVVLGGGNGIIPMMVRSFGGGAQEARKKGYSVGQQLSLGLANAATEYFSEKLFGGNPAYDADVGLVNRAISAALNKIDPKTAGRVMSVLSSTAAETMNEGWEEVVSDLLDPMWEYVIAGAEDNRTKQEKLQQYVEDWVVGVLLGGMGQAGSVVSDTLRGNDTAKAAAEAAPVSVTQDIEQQADSLPHENSEATAARIFPESAQQTSVSVTNQNTVSAKALKPKTGGNGSYTMENAAPVSEAAERAVRDLGIGPSVPVERTADSLPAYGTENAARQAEFRRAQQIAERFGAAMEVAEVEHGADGKYANGVITISPNAKNPVMSVMVHELTHHMESSGRYAQFSKSILDHIARESSVGVEEMRGAVKARYAESGIELDDAAAEREIVAQYAESKLFQDEQAISRLARQNRSLTQMIRDWLSDLTVKLRGTGEERFIRNAERMYARALRNVGKTAGDEATRYMISSTTEGKPVAVVESDILSSLDTTSWDEQKKEEAKRAAKAALLEIRDGVPVNGINYKINRTSRREYTRSNDTERLYRTNKDAFADKMRAASVAGDVIIATTDWARDGGLTHPRKDNFADFVHGDVLLQSGESKYTAKTVVGITANGEYVLYDVTDLVPTSFQTNEELPTTAARQKPVSDIQGSSSDSYDTTNTAEVNRQNLEEPRYLSKVESDESEYSLGGSFDDLLGEPRYLPTAEQIESETEAWREQSLADAANERDMIEAERRGRIANEGMQLEDGTQVSPEVAEAIERMRARRDGPPRLTVRDNIARTKAKADFEGTSALQKLGVKIANSVGVYEDLEQLKGRDQAAKKARRERRKAESRLDATKAERSFANGIAAGTYAVEDIPSSMDREKVTELADYYRAEQASGDDRIKARRKTINRALEEQMKYLFRDSDRFKPESGLVMSYRTPQRIMNAIFGETRARAINEAIFNPVAENEAERLRFVNRMFDQVRTFRGKDGKMSGLTEEESALVQQVIEGRAAAEEVAGLEMRSAIENAAQNVRNGGSIGDAAHEFSLNADERALAERYARWMETETALESGNVDSVKVENAVKKYGEMFDDFYDAINDFLVAHGYEPIGFTKGYAPHIQSEENQDLLNKAFKAMGINTDVSNLPTSIAGQTGYYKPNKRWNPFFLHRTSEQTTYDIVSAYESYVNYMSDILYHTDDIMRVRQAANYFRTTYAPDEIKNKLDWANELKYGTAEQKTEFLRNQGVISPDTELSYEDATQRMDEYVDQLFGDIEKTTKYSDFVMWLDNYANLLAGKQNMADRGSEIKGRTLLNLGNRLQRAFARTQVAANVSSMLNQTAQLPQIRAELGAKYTAEAIRDIFSGAARKGAWAESSDFLTEKRGVEYLTKTPSEKILSGMFWGAGFTDEMISTIAVRGKYLKEIAAGKTPTEAMKAADQFGKEVMGSRAKGSIPTAFTEKNLISQMVNVFQVEALNSWEHISQDLPREFRETARTQGTAKAARDVGGVLAKTLLSTFILNRIAEGVYGGTPAPFDILGLAANFVASGEGLPTNDYLLRILNRGWAALFGEALFDDGDDEDREFDWKQATDDLAYNISNDVPFVRNISGVLGLGDNTLPLPDIYGGVTDIGKAINNHGIASGETVKATASLLAELAPGGKQAKKLGLGLEALIRGGDFSGYGEDARLKYPIEATPTNVIKSLVFGKYATSASNRFYAAGDTSLSANQTKLWREMVKSGADSSDVYDTIQTYRKIGNDDELTSFEQGVLQRELLRETDFTDREKLDMYRGLNTNATSRVEKFEAMMNAGMDFGTVMDVYDAYALYNNDETLSAGQKATEFAKWINGTALSKKQKDLAKDQLKYFVSTPAEATRYEKLTDVGLSSEKAYDLTNIIAAIAPEKGQKNVSDMQKYRAIAGTNIPDKDKVAAIGSIMGTEMTTENGGESQYAKMVGLIDKGVTISQYLDLKDAGVVDSYVRYQDAQRNRNFGIEPEDFITFVDKKASYDADVNSKYTQREVQAAIDGIFGGSLTREQKAVLWQLQNKSWTPRNNPYDTRIGEYIYDNLYNEEPLYLAAP